MTNNFSLVNKYVENNLIADNIIAKKSVMKVHAKNVIKLFYKNAIVKNKKKKYPVDQIGHANKNV